LSDVPEHVQKFIRFLRDANWHRSLLKMITDFLEGHRYSASEIDSLMMSVTKAVETNLRDAVTRCQESPVPRNVSYGIRLLNYAVNCGLIRNREEPIYALLYWIFKEPRNTSHHEFVSYPYNTLVLFMSEANEALERIEHLIEYPYRAHFNMIYDQEEQKIKIENAKIWRPNGTPLPTDQKVEISINFPDRTLKTIPLSPHENGYWRGEYDARGQLCGTVYTYLGVVNHGTRFVVSSGSTIAVTFPSGESCPYCGSLITWDTSICPYCGKRLRVI